MKKICALALSLIICILFCSCGGNTGSGSDGNGVNLADALKNGKIPEIDVVLGADIKALEEKALNSENESEEIYFIQKDEYSYFLNQNSYYYENEKKDKGISSIVSVGTAFGLGCGYETVESVKNAFPNVTFTQSATEPDELYFLPYITDGCEKLSFKSDNREIRFIFSDNLLLAINLVDTENWSR